MIRCRKAFSKDERNVVKSRPSIEVKNFETSMEKLTLEKKAPGVVERKIADLPDEILLKILEYLSTNDILGKMARVSKRFYRLSQDQNLINRLEFMGTNMLTTKDWTEERREKYYNGFFKACKNAQKLKFLSLHLEKHSLGRFRNWVQPSVNHQYLEEFCVQLKKNSVLFPVISLGFSTWERVYAWEPHGLKTCLDFLKHGLFKVLDQCPKLKILTIELDGQFLGLDVPLILGAISSFSSKSLQELHLKFDSFGGDPVFLRHFFKKMGKNMPKVQYFSLALEDPALDPPEHCIFQEIAFENKIKIEIRSVQKGNKLIF